MRNYTLKRRFLLKSLLFTIFFLSSGTAAFSQFYSTHYIAPAPWQYYSDANEIVIATESSTLVNVVLSKSDGTIIANLTTIKGNPAVYRFAGAPNSLNLNALNTIVNGAGLIIKSLNGTTSINLRNVASDYAGLNDRKIKGNAALTSFGDAGIGSRFRIGYYRDGSLGNFGSFGEQSPTYTIMAINDGTSIKLNGTTITTLNAGQSYLFKAPMGSLVESSNVTVMNTSAHIDTPAGCGDGTIDQIAPESVLGVEYFIQRGKGNNTAEQTTVIATKDNTDITINTFSVTGTLVSTVTQTLANAGDFYTFNNGVSSTSFSASRILATKNVAVYSGTAQSCEVDISTIAPVSACGGSTFIETAKFTHYNNNALPYFGYVLLQDASAKVYVNNVDIESIVGIFPRYELGTTGWYLINFDNVKIGNPDFLSVSSAAKMTISIVQQGGGFSMAGFFSNFTEIPDAPSVTYINGGECQYDKAELATPLGFAPYQWYFNGSPIAGETLNTHTATSTGLYSVESTLACGSRTQSKALSVTLCTDLEVLKTVNDATPCIGSEVEFAIKVTNLGPNNVVGLTVDDLLPSGYTFVEATPYTGTTYDSGTGVWNIGQLADKGVVTLKVTATVKATGIYTNTAAIPSGSQVDPNLLNNTSSVATTPKVTPSVAVAGADQTNVATCGLTTVTLAANTPTVGTGKWTIVSGAGGTFSLDTDPNTTFSGTAGTAYILRWTITNGSCTASTDDVAVTFNEIPTANITGNLTTCLATTLTAVTDATTAKYIWYKNNIEISGEVGSSLIVSTNGDYKVKITNSDTSCEQISSVSTVMVEDAIDPTITCSGDVTVNVDPASTVATVVLTPPTTADNCEIATTTNDHPSSSFTIGTTTVTWTTTDKSGNSASCSQTVTVNAAAPSISLVKTAVFNDENGDGYSQPGETITYSFEVTNTGNTTLTAITISDPLPGIVMTGGPITLLEGDTDIVSFKGTYTIVQSDINTGSVTNQATVYGTSPDGTIIENKADNVTKLDDQPVVLPESECLIKVFNAVSVNGSGGNNNFYIEGIDCYPDNTVEIYNRWGVLVYESDHYNNEDRSFRGISEGRVTVDRSQELPVGTYFYIFKYKDTKFNTFEKSGYLYLNRK